MMMRNGSGDGDETGKGNVNGDHHHRKQQEGHESLKKFDFPIPPGYRFQPTDEELIKYYLYPKINKLQLPPNSFKDVNIYAFTPWDLADRYRSGKDKVFYFFTPRERKYSRGKHRNRAANGGYWKGCGTDRIVDEDTNEEIGHKRMFVFYLGKSPKSADSKMAKILSKNGRTNWYMHEYALKQLDDFVLCKIYLTSRKSTENMAVDVAVPHSIPTTSAIVPSVNHHYYGEINQHQLQSAILPSVNHKYYGEVNQQQLQSATLPSANHHYNGNGEVNQQQLQEEILQEDDNGEMNQEQLQLQAEILQQWQEEILQEDCNGEMNQEQLQLQAEILQQLQEEISSSANHHYNGEMDQQQQHEEYEWNMPVAEINNIGSQPTSMVQEASPSYPISVQDDRLIR